MVWCQFVARVVVLITDVIEPPGGYTRHAATAGAGSAATADSRTAAPFSSPAHSLTVSAAHSISRLLSSLLSPRLTLIPHSRSALGVVTHRLVSSPAGPALPAPTLALLSPLCAAPPVGPLTCSLTLASHPVVALVALRSRIACSPARPALPAPTLNFPTLTHISHSRSALSVVTHRIVSSPAEPALPAPTLALLAPLCATPPMGRLTCSLALASRPFMALVASWSRIACSPAKPALPAPAPPPPFALFPHSPKGH